MGLFQKAKERMAMALMPDLGDAKEFKDKYSRMSIDELAELVNANQTVQPNFFNLQSDYVSNVGAASGMYDRVISPAHLYDMCNKDTYVPSLIQQLIGSIFKRKSDGGLFYVDRVENKHGVKLGSPSKALLFEDQLKRIEFVDEIAQRLIWGFLADGGGNVLVFPVKTSRGIEMRCEPFLRDGDWRVRVFGNNSYKKITKYEVTNREMTPIHTLLPEKMWFRHYRFSNVSGSYLFSNSPGKEAVYWFMLKKEVAGSTENSFSKNGLQNIMVSTPDYGAYKIINDILKEGGAPRGANGINPGFANVFEYFKRLKELNTESWRALTGNARTSNKLIEAVEPRIYTPVGRNIQEMQVKTLIEMADLQMTNAYRTSQAMIDSRFSKYSNWQNDYDNWQQLVVDPMKTYLEFVAEDLLEFYFPDYDPNIYLVKFGRDPNEEDIQAYQLENQKNQIIGQNLKLASEISDYKFNPDANKWEPKIANEGGGAPNVIEGNKLSAGQISGTMNIIKALITKELTTVAAYQLLIASGINSDTANQMVESTKNAPPPIQTGQTPPSSTSTQVSMTTQIPIEKNLRQAKQTLAERALETRDSKRFEGIIARAVKHQLSEYIKKLKTYKDLKTAIKNLPNDLKPITQMGLPVNTVKQQELKFAKEGVKDFEQTSKSTRAEPDFEISGDVEFLIDAKSQWLTKGWKSLTKEQQNILEKIYGDEVQNYSGMDEQTSAQVNNLLNNAYEQEGGVSGAVEDLTEELDDLSEGRAKTIAETEITQALNGSRWSMYSEWGNWKKWVDSNDDRVREEHKENSEQGWIPIDEAFSNGNMWAGEDFNCRCDTIYDDAEEKPEW